MKVKVKVAQSCPTLCDPMDPARLLCPWNSPGQSTGVGSHSLLQGIFPTQGLNPGLPHCRWILHPLSHWGSPNFMTSNVLYNSALKYIYSRLLYLLLWLSLGHFKLNVLTLNSWYLLLQLPVLLVPLYAYSLPHF